MNDILEIMSKAMIDCCDFPNAAAEDALTALTAAGYVVVPREPTIKMLAVSYGHRTAGVEWNTKTLWAAMIAAAAPQAGEGS